jgi:hypothetical protein
MTVALVGLTTINRTRSKEHTMMVTGGDSQSALTAKEEWLVLFV